MKTVLQAAALAAAVGVALALPGAQAAEPKPDGYLLVELQWCLLGDEEAAADAECRTGMDTWKVHLAPEGGALGEARTLAGCRWMGETVAKAEAAEAGWFGLLAAGAVHLQVMTRCVPAVRAQRA